MLEHGVLVSHVLVAPCTMPTAWTSHAIDIIRLVTERKSWSSNIGKLSFKCPVNTALSAPWVMYLLVFISLNKNDNKVVYNNRPATSWDRTICHIYSFCVTLWAAALLHWPPLETICCSHPGWNCCFLVSMEENWAGVELVEGQRGWFGFVWQFIFYGSGLGLRVVSWNWGARGAIYWVAGDRQHSYSFMCVLSNIHFHIDIFR